MVFDDNVPQVRPGMTADVDILTGTHEKTLAVPIQAVVIRTQSQLDRAAKSAAGTHGSAKAATRKDARNQVAAFEDTVGRKDPEIPGIMVVRDNVARFVPVKTGLTSETMIEVMGDVKEGETVVSGPYKALRELKPNAKVKREQAGAKPGAH